MLPSSPSSPSSRTRRRPSNAARLSSPPSPTSNTAPRAKQQQQQQQQRVLLLLLSRYYLFISFIYLQHTRTPPRQSSALFMERMSLGGGWEHVPCGTYVQRREEVLCDKNHHFYFTKPSIITLYTLFLRNFMHFCVPFIFVVTLTTHHSLSPPKTTALSLST